MSQQQNRSHFAQTWLKIQKGICSLKFCDSGTEQCLTWFEISETFSKSNPHVYVSDYYGQERNKSKNYLSHLLRFCWFVSYFLLMGVLRWWSFNSPSCTVTITQGGRNITLCKINPHPSINNPTCACKRPKRHQDICNHCSKSLCSNAINVIIESSMKDT